MASESISPAGFYSVRGFGYKRFDKVEPNNLNNRIILYDKFPVFNINDKEFENYPLVIEIDTKTIGEDIIKEYKNGVFYAEETIYLNPFSTQFIFNNETERRSTLSKVEQSLNTKMMPLYHSRILVKPSEIDSFDWQYFEMEDSKEDFAKYISKDRKINKLKGFLYAYLLGSNKSLPTEVVALKKYAKELGNVLSAIITSPDNRATYQQKEQLNKLYQSISNAFFRTDEKLQYIIRQKVEQYKCKNFIDILRLEGIFDYWCQKQNIKPQFQITTFDVSSSSSPDEKQIAFDNYVSNLSNTINKIAVPRQMKVEDLPILQHCNRIETIPKQKDFLSKLLNEYLSEIWNSEKFISSRVDFATAGGKLFKEELQDKWENSSYQKYINDLRNNLASHTAFSVQCTDIENLTLKSFAVFCQKGEDDIDKLEDYLISNEIGDFRIAFALWGIVFGFANMPKTLTNDLFLSNNLNYIAEVYKYIFKQVHGIDLVGNLERKQEETEYVSIPSKMNEQPKYEEKNKITTQQQTREIEINYREILKKVNKITESQINSVIEILKKSHFSINDKLFDSISKIEKLGKRTKIFKAIKECLQPKKQSFKQQEPSLFEKETESVGTEFYKDKNVLSNIYPILSNDEERKKVKKEIEWIQKVHNENGYKKKSGEWVELVRHSNKEVIKHFENNCKKRLDKNILDKIVAKLNELYSQNE
jgi:hypothetical protein